MALSIAPLAGNVSPLATTLPFGARTLPQPVNNQVATARAPLFIALMSKNRDKSSWRFCLRYGRRNLFRNSASTA